MQQTIDHRGFRIEAEADPSSGTVAVRIFALEADGKLVQGAEPMNEQSYTSPKEERVSMDELMAGALELGRSAIDQLLGGGTAPMEATRPGHEIVAAVKAGEPGRLSVPFASTDRGERLNELRRVLDSIPLNGLRATILLNPEDLAGQALPETRPDLAGCSAQGDVPRGEFHLLLERGEASPEGGSP
jgi:hypothetical protein